MIIYSNLLPERYRHQKKMKLDPKKFLLSILLFSLVNIPLRADPIYFRVMNFATLMIAYNGERWSGS